MTTRSRNAKRGKANRTQAACVGDVAVDGEGMRWRVEDADAESVRLACGDLWRRCTWERFAERYAVTRS